MERYKIISKISSVFLLLLMMLCITPKIFLHEMFADHKDAPSCNDARIVGPCIHKQGYNCQQSEIVVPGAYLVSESQEFTMHREFHIIQKLSCSSALSQNFIGHSQERAPPAYV